MNENITYYGDLHWMYDMPNDFTMRAIRAMVSLVRENYCYLDTTTQGKANICATAHISSDELIRAMCYLIGVHVLVRLPEIRVGDDIMYNKGSIVINPLFIWKGDEQCRSKQIAILKKYL